MPPDNLVEEEEPEAVLDAQYTYLGDEDIIQRGDEFFQKGEWIKAFISIGFKKVNSIIQHNTVRRKIAPSIAAAPPLTAEKQKVRDEDEAKAIQKSIDNDRPHVLLVEVRTQNRADAEQYANSWVNLPHSFHGRKCEKVVLGIVADSEYDSERQRYVFLEDGDTFQEGDEFLYEDKCWYLVQLICLGRTINSVAKGGIYRRKVV